MASRIAPALDDAFAAETARLAGMLLTISANAVDDAAALRVNENAAMRALFADAADVVGGEDLRAATVTRDTDLRLSALDVENDRLRRLLVDLHALVETRTDDATRQLDTRIWRLLERFEARRAPSTSGQSAPASLG